MASHHRSRRANRRARRLGIERLEDRTLLNNSPAAPVIIEPVTDGQIVNPADVHMETQPMSDPDAGDTHVASDFEIWRQGASPELVWNAYNVTGLEKVHIHLGDGTFDNSYAGRTDLEANSDYYVRIRHEDSSGDPATEWSAWSVRTFHTSTPQPGTDVAWTVEQPGFVVEAVAHEFQLPVNIAFVSNPSSNPGDPLFYVTELYGNIKVVHNDFTVSDYATNLLNFNPTGDFPGSGEQGVSGIVVEPTTGDLFVSMLYSSNPSDEQAPHYAKVVRFHSNDGGLSAATQTTVIDMVGETEGASHFISNLSIGPDGKLYVHNGDGFEDATALNLDSFRGKILRMNLDGSAPSDNPFYDAANGITARDYIFAYGVRNPFGGAWRAADGKPYEVENGPSVDRFAQINRGENFGFNGTDASMRTGALYNWDPAIAPVNLAFIQSSTFGGSRFPTSMFDHAFVTQSGATWASGPQPDAKSITEFTLDAAGNRLSGPDTLVKYTGTGKASVAALAAGPDGLYFSDLYKDQNYTTPIDRGANILRIRYVGTAMPVPTNLSAVAASNTQINLSWQDNASDEEGFVIQRREGIDGEWMTIADYKVPNATSYQDTGLLEGTTYYYRIWALKTNGASPFSNETSANTAGTGPAPNNAPVLSATASFKLSPVAEDTTGDAGIVISALVGAGISDSDPGAAEGIAVTSFSGNGTWQFSDTGGATWDPIEGVSDSLALMLPDSFLVRFVPAADFNGSATFTFRAWDQTSGNAEGRADLSRSDSVGGSTAFSAISRMASITVTPVNDAPVLDGSATPTLASTRENTKSASVTAATLLGTAVSDVDAAALKGIAVTAVGGGGVWQYSLDSGVSFLSLGSPSDAAARLLRAADRVRFVPAPNFNGTSTLTFRAWDRTVGNGGGTFNISASGTGGTTAFSINQLTASIAVTPVNNAPVLMAGSSLLTPINVNASSPAGDTVSSFAGAFISDVDAGAGQGIAVVAVSGPNTGQWQFSIDAGASWNNFGTVAAASARLLGGSDMIRLLPASNLTVIGTVWKPWFSFRAWDQTSGSAGQTANIVNVGGTTAFSATARLARIVVNDAPVLDNTGAISLPTMREDTRNLGTLVSKFAGAAITDSGTAAVKGIAVIGIGVGGRWQYSLDGGLTFKDFGSPSESTARLLRPADRVRFLPSKNFNGSSTITFRAWDRTAGAAGGVADINTLGVGGTGAISVNEATAGITITPVNDAPVLAAGVPLLPPGAVNDTNPAGVTSDSLVGGFISDVDGPTKGIAVYGAFGNVNGQWQFSMDNGSTWNSVGTVSPSTALLLDASDLIRFLANPGYSLTRPSSIMPALTYRAWDESIGVPGQLGNITSVGGTSAFSLAAQVARVRVNDAPTLTSASPTIGSIASNARFVTTVAAMLGTSVQDAGNGTLQGIAVTGLAPTPDGRWQCSVDGGLTFWNLAGVADNAARLLRASDLLRYVPLTGATGVATITYRAWDQTTGSAGRVVDLTFAGAVGPRSAFSSATDTASLNVT